MGIDFKRLLPVLIGIHLIATKVTNIAVVYGTDMNEVVVNKGFVHTRVTNRVHPRKWIQVSSAE